jgi:hypothetical protein
MTEKKHVSVTSNDINQPDTAATSIDLIEYCRRKIIKTGNNELSYVKMLQVPTSTTNLILYIKRPAMLVYTFAHAE